MHNDSWVKWLRHVVLLQLFILAACGKGFEEEEQQEENYTGRFQGRLTSLNQKFGAYRGNVAITIEDNQFWARVKVEGPKNETMHAQYIHVGSRCPDMGDDLNRDGYLDFMEAYRVAGPVLIPLDSNLNSQQKGLNDFPRMKRHSFYYYSEACNTQFMMEDLRREDVIIDDMITKLKRKEELDLESRVLMIYGVSEDRTLPSTMRSYDGYPRQHTLPVACGKLSEGYSHAFDQ